MSAEELALEGRWIPVAAELSGQLLNVAELRVAALSFAEQRYAIVDCAQRTVDSGIWEMGAVAHPRYFDLLGVEGPNAGRRVLAIIELDGDRLCIGYDMERNQRPAGWRHAPDQLLLCITYARDAGHAAGDDDV